MAQIRQTKTGGAGIKTYSSATKAQWNNLKLENGVVYRQYIRECENVGLLQLLVPHQMRDRLTQEVHCNITGHLDAQKHGYRSRGERTGTVGRKMWKYSVGPVPRIISISGGGPETWKAAGYADGRSNGEAPCRSYRPVPKVTRVRHGLHLYLYLCFHKVRYSCAYSRQVGYHSSKGTDRQRFSESGLPGNSANG